MDHLSEFGGELGCVLEVAIFELDIEHHQCVIIILEGIVEAMTWFQWLVKNGGIRMLFDLIKQILNTFVGGGNLLLFIIVFIIIVDLWFGLILVLMVVSSVHTSVTFISQDAIGLRIVLS